MSHFIRIKTKMAEKQYLVQGYGNPKGGLTI